MLLNQAIDKNGIYLVMLLQQVLDVIEFTDSDQLSSAIEQFNHHGVLRSDLLPFMSVVFEKAPEQLAKKLSAVGFNGDVQVAQVDNKLGEANFLVFDSLRFGLSTALEWSEAC
ncbi:hypothetical protein [Agarivorans sp. Toyoura001]|uniref:hypothetical protein n=1 Tax=unclassified Agarivorans TaxID=2636026 RepID=UPI0010E7D2F7|nr:hypothetical protein [Agarivorans sp. Toyoura001]GDY26929.1 hypothetical protein AHAT_28190 [Agarivorans sp. Toyoura001]